MRTFETKLEQERKIAETRYRPLFCGRCGSDISDLELNLYGYDSGMAVWRYTCPVCNYRISTRGSKPKNSPKAPKDAPAAK